eukprot:3115216-Rhodomonas_salina.1
MTLHSANRRTRDPWAAKTRALKEYQGCTRTHETVGAHPRTTSGTRFPDIDPDAKQCGLPRANNAPNENGLRILEKIQMECELPRKCRRVASLPPHQKRAKSTNPSLSSWASCTRFALADKSRFLQDPTISTRVLGSSTELRSRQACHALLVRDVLVDVMRLVEAGDVRRSTLEMPELVRVLAHVLRRVPVVVEQRPFAVDRDVVARHEPLRVVAVHSSDERPSVVPRFQEQEALALYNSREKSQPLAQQRREATHSTLPHLDQAQLRTFVRREGGGSCRCVVEDCPRWCRVIGFGNIGVSLR